MKEEKRTADDVLRVLGFGFFTESRLLNVLICLKVSMVVVLYAIVKSTSVLIAWIPLVLIMIIGLEKCVAFYAGLVTSLLAEPNPEQQIQLIGTLLLTGLWPLLSILHFTTSAWKNSEV